MGDTTVSRRMMDGRRTVGCTNVDAVLVIVVCSSSTGTLLTLALVIMAPLPPAGPTLGPGHALEVQDIPYVSGLEK